MKYDTGYYRHPENNVFSLVLKHLVYHKSGEELALACLCGGGEGGKHMAEKIIEWFYRKGLGLSQRVGMSGEKLENCFFAEMEKWDIGSPAAVLLCKGEGFLLWRREGISAFVLQERLGLPVCSPLAGEEKFLRGNIQTGVGILLATADFVRTLPTELLAECLAVRELQEREGRSERRIRELGEEAVRRGGVNAAAILVLTDKTEYFEEKETKIYE